MLGFHLIAFMDFAHENREHMAIGNVERELTIP